MSVPEHLWRFPTRAAIASLASRFDLPNTPDMQDWEWEVADPDRIDEFLAVYKSGDLNDDEKFTLMEMLIQSFAESDDLADKEAQWSETLSIIEDHLDLHIYSVWYWGTDDEPTWAHVTRPLRRILEKHRDKYAGPTH